MFLQLCFFTHDFCWYKIPVLDCQQFLTVFPLPGSFAGLGFLSLYLSGKIKAFNRQGHVAKLCIVILPLLLASLVGVSRVDDYRHHWEDVFVGGLIGFIMAVLCYLHFFPPPYHDQGCSIFLTKQICFQ
uniref:Phosphatidic acid phosphatase type 2/haloperoxidase domain-containing protein n=1 Tax=Zea mays TaxID=4577 RepID=C0HJ36_MAIZE|nr:unknown [Zea mays]